MSADALVEAKKQEKIAKKAESEAKRAAKEAEAKASSLAAKAEKHAKYVKQQEADVLSKAKRIAQRQYAHWLRNLKRPVSQEALDKMTTEQLIAKTPGLKEEFEAVAAEAKKEKEKRKIENLEQTKVQNAEAAEKRNRSVTFSFDSEAMLEKMKATCASKGEIESIKFVVGGVGKLPGVQVCYKDKSSAKAMLGAKIPPVSVGVKARPAPSPTRAISFVLNPEVIQKGSVVTAASTALTSAKVKGITMVSSSKGQITVEFATAADAEKGLGVVNEGFKVGGMKVARGAELGLARRLPQDEGNNKKRKVEK